MLLVSINRPSWILCYGKCVISGHRKLRNTFTTKHSSFSGQVNRAVQRSARTVKRLRSLGHCSRDSHQLRLNQPTKEHIDRKRMHLGHKGERVFKHTSLVNSFTTADNSFRHLCELENELCRVTSKRHVSSISQVQRKDQPGDSVLGDTSCRLKGNGALSIPSLLYLPLSCYHGFVASGAPVSGCSRSLTLFRVCVVIACLFPASLDARKHGKRAQRTVDACDGDKHVTLLHKVKWISFSDNIKTSRRTYSYGLLRQQRYDLKGRCLGYTNKYNFL